MGAPAFKAGPVLMFIDWAGIIALKHVQPLSGCWLKISFDVSKLIQAETRN